MECGPRPGAGEEGYAVGRGIARELLGPRFSPFVVGDATQDVPPQGNQFNELGLTADSRAAPRLASPLLPVDLRLQIRQREDTCRRGELAIDHPAGCCRCIAASRHHRPPQSDLSSESSILAGGFGSGGARYGKAREARTACWSTPSLIRGPLPALISMVSKVSAMSSLGDRPPQVSWLAPFSNARSISK